MRIIKAIALLLVLLVALAGSALYYIDRITRAKVDPAHKELVSHVQSELRRKGYFTPREIAYPHALFFCVCGPYSSCEPQSRDQSAALNYQRPAHDFVTGISRSRQLLMYFLRDQIVSIEMPHEWPFFAREHEAYCNTDLDMKVVRTDRT
jgi:hypothetical protein